jgi:hypothetical protein
MPFERDQTDLPSNEQPAQEITSIASTDPSGKLVHKKDGTVSMTVWSRAASWPSFSRASLSSWLSAFWTS